MRFTPPLSTPLRDPNAEAVRKNTDHRIRELQTLTGADMHVIENVELPNGARVPVAHGLGRRPRVVLVSPVRLLGTGPLTSGVILDYGDRGAPPTGFDPVDRSQIVVLQAGGYTSTVVVDVVLL
jgi:hypothetical protein